MWSFEGNKILYGDIKWWFSFTISQCFMPDLVVVIEAIWAHPTRLWALKMPFLILTSFTSDIQDFWENGIQDASIWLLLKSCRLYLDFRVFLSTPSNVCTYVPYYAACNGEESEACRKIDQRKHIWLCVQIRTSQLKSSQVLFNQDVIILQLKKQKRQSPHKLTMERLSRVQLYYVGNGVVKKWK